MTVAELRAKFDDNAGSALDTAARDRLAAAVAAVDTMDDAGALTGLIVGQV